MAVKTITITEEAYRRLSRVKGPGESFSEVINRMLVGTRATELIGILRSEAASKVEGEIGRIRRDLDRRLTRTARSVRS